MREGLLMGVMVTAVLIALSVCPAAVAQETLPEMVLGQWEGTATSGQCGGPADTATFAGSTQVSLVFSETAGRLTWTFSYRYDPDLWGNAEGTVTAFTPPAVELMGPWTEHAVRDVVGTGVRFSLTIDGDRMKGTVMAEGDDIPLVLYLTRTK
jgi:hypothetical protein